MSEGRVIISPGGFERYFEEIVDMGGVAAMTPEAFRDLRERYSLEMDLDSVPVLAERFGLRLPPKR